MLTIGLLSLAGCSPYNFPNPELNVPFRHQEEWDYCMAACIQMWQGYHRLPETPQSVIHQFYGGSGGQLQAMANAVAHFVFSYSVGVIAMLDYTDDPDPDPWWRTVCAKQITSIEQREPFIPILYSLRHAVTVKGGEWYPEGSYKVWSGVSSHDPWPPDVGWADRRFSSGEYRNALAYNYNVAQYIINEHAIAGWHSNLVTWGSSVWDSEDHWEPENDV